MDALNTNSETLSVQITYLRQQQRPARQAPPRPLGITALMRAEEPPVHFYRYLFNRVGEPHKWVSRRYMSDTRLAAIVSDPDVYIYVPYYKGVPCGFGEIDARPSEHPKGDVEIKFLGLMPEVHRLGIGRWFFHNIVDLAWSLNPREVLIETCTADHPAALPLYQKFGFTPYSTGRGVIEWRG
ncbi:GNAT family N-acetyltransferase [Parvularcula flava]|uniref:N-acetyltransferase n=1 Tax=Aquisalinus luteolus TaxID=1566827 RepID=A0A8J3A634_9PROT|nr:GNAT family N-acetyltransferase [Aquisalinus luteolus]NHK27621.1 GNAT family N-acetyltransferase [Aquisalinus luteolus]GGH95993.1 N-acetyltransferase [Aquisalinus luteolus]